MKIFLILQFLNYLLRAKTDRWIHSPFVFTFYRQVLKGLPAYEQETTDLAAVEVIRQKMQGNEKSILVHDLGAGSAKMNSNRRKISEIARHALLPNKYVKLLHRLVGFVDAKRVLELGTSLGVTTSALAIRNPDSLVWSVEGAAAIAAIARNNWNSLKLGNIRLINADFDAAIDQLLNAGTEFDLVFIDGNHQKEATVRYFEKLLPGLNGLSVMLFDDIYWSRDMYKAWKEILEHPKVTVSIDLFRLGIVFFNPGLSKEQFCLRY